MEIRKSQPWKYCIGQNFHGSGLNFHGSLILWIFNCSRIILTWDTKFNALTARASMDRIPGINCRICEKLSIFEVRSHCFADSCELEWTTVWQYSACSISMPHPLCITCMHVRTANLRNYINETKSSNIPIRENVDPWRFSAVWYSPHPLNHKCPSH